MFFFGISLSTNTAVIGLTSLLFNKTVNGFNSKIAVFCLEDIII